MCRHAGFQWEGARQRELSRGSGARCGGGRGEQLCCAVYFVLYIPVICIVVVAVPSVCCSVKLPLSRPTSFCLFLSILLRTPAGGGAVACRFCCRPQPNHNKINTFWAKTPPQTPQIISIHFKFRYCFLQASRLESNCSCKARILLTIGTETFYNHLFSKDIAFLSSTLSLCPVISFSSYFPNSFFNIP